MTTEVTTQQNQARGKRKSAALLSLALGAALAALVALAGTARQADAASPQKIFFVSERTTGTGVYNPTADYEIFKMNSDGTGVKQLTLNEVDDYNPTLSPDGEKIAYETVGIQPSNPEGDWEIYNMNATDGKGKKNLSNNGPVVEDYDPVFSPGGKRIAYTTEEVQPTNPEGDREVYVMNALDGTGKRNLTNNGVEVSGAYPVEDRSPDFSPDGEKIAYTSEGEQPSNPEGDQEIYRMNTPDGTGKKNLSNNGLDVYDYLPDFSPGGKKIAYESDGIQTSNPQGDEEIYMMNVLDGKGKKNLTNNGNGVYDELPHFSPDGKKVAYESNGIQPSNPEGDDEIYIINPLDGSGRKNLTNNGTDIYDERPRFSPDGTKVSYTSYGAQTSNPEGDWEIYRMSALDGKDKKNLTHNGSDDFDSDWGV